MSWGRSVPFKANAERRHHIPKQRHRVTNSAAYDAALRQRGSLTIWFTDAAIAAWKAEPRTTRGGQPRYSALAITVALTLRAVFRLALRQTEGLIGSIIALLGLAVPDHTTLSRRAESLDVVCPRSCSGPVHLLVDSTGLKLCGSGEWLLEKHGTRTRRSWRKLHIAVDADTGQIAAAALTTSDVDDASQIGALLNQVDGPVASFTADGAYDQDGVYGEVVARHPEASVIVPPRSNAVPSDTAETAPTMRDHRRARPYGLAEGPLATIGGLWSKLTSVASNGSSVTAYDHAPTRAERPRSRLLSKRWAQRRRPAPSPGAQACCPDGHRRGCKAILPPRHTGPSSGEGYRNYDEQFDCLSSQS